MCLNFVGNVLMSVIGKTESRGGVRSNIYRLHLDLVVKQLCYNATFRNQKLCCCNVFLHKNDEPKNSSGLQFKAQHPKRHFSVQVKLDKSGRGGVLALLQKIKHNDLMSEKHKKTCKYLNYVEHWLISFNFCIWFISLCSCWYCKFYSRNKNLHNHLQKLKYKSIIKKNKKHD